MQDDGKNLANVCHEVSQLPSHRAYLSIAISARRVPVVVQHVERAPGTPALEVLLFPTECHPLLVSGSVLASLLSRSSSRSSSPRHVHVEKENLLQICEDPYHTEHESLVGLGTASLDGKKEEESEMDLEGKLRNLRLEDNADKSCEEETRGQACDVQ